MLKWKLMLTTLPYVLVVVIAKSTLNYYFGFHGIIEFSEVSWILTGGIFLMGFMLAGTMSDYKESEKLPADIACSLETIEESFTQAASTKPGVVLVEARKAILRVTDDIIGWLHKKMDVQSLYTSLEKLNESIGGLETAGATPIGVRALNELNGLRKSISRVNVISKTGFLSSGYAMLDTLVIIIVAVILLTSFKNHLSEIILVAFVPLVYIYLLRLIRDIDDPFEYEDGIKKNADEIPLFPLEDYRKRLAGRCG